MKFGNCKRIFILLLMIICMSGCTVDYDVSIDDKGIITETVVFMEDNETIEAINPDISDFISRYYRLYASDDDIISYKKEEIYNDKTSGIRLSKIYASYEDYVMTSPFFKEAYPGSNYETEGDISKIDGGVFAIKERFTSNINGIEGGLEKITSSIQIPYFMEKFSGVEQKDDKYVHTYTKSSQEDALYFEYDVTKSPLRTEFFIPGEWIVLIMYGAFVIFVIVVVMYFNWKNNRI